MLKPDDHVLQFVDDYLHEVLTQPDAHTLQQHCEKCSICRAALKEAEKRFAKLKELPPSEASEDLITGTIDNLEDTIVNRQQRWKYFGRTILYATATSILLIATCHLYFFLLKPSPYELRLLGQEHLLAGTPAALRVGMFDHRDGRPLSGVPITLTLFDPSKENKPVELASFTTNSNGLGGPQIELPDWKEGDYQLRVVARTSGKNETLSETIHLTRSWKLMLSPDKPVYKPGQTIRLKALALRRPDLKPVSGQAVVFSITDPKGNVIFKRPDVTSDYGITSADCPLASEILEGTYNIECRVGDTVGRSTVEVFKYVLPKFKVAMTLDKTYFTPGEQVTVEVQSNYFFGKSVADANVELTATSPDIGRNVLFKNQAKTDDQGAAKFTFRLPDSLVGRPQSGGNARVRFTATVTDSAGQSYSSSAARVVAQHPVQLTVIPESGSLVRDAVNKVYIYAAYVDGRPAQVDIFTNNQSLKTDQLGVAALELTPTGQEVGLTLKASDPSGRVLGRKHVELVVGQVARDFILRPNKAVFDGGETIVLDALGGGVEPVFVDFLKDGQTMLSQTIDMKAGQGQTKLELPTELFGAIRLIAYRFGDDGLPVRKERTIVVRQARQLNIAATLDDDAALNDSEFRPGQTAKLKIKLTDQEGNPAVGAVSLSAVDEKVFSVLSQTPGMEQTFFLLEQELLEPIYTIYSGWTTEAVPVATSQERIRFEQALFSAAAATAVGNEAVPTAFRQDTSSETSDVEPQFVMIDNSRSMQQTSSPFTLASNSFPEKWQRITSRREWGLGGAIVAWWSLAGGLVLVGLSAFAVARPKAFFISMSGVVFLGVSLFALLSLSVVVSNRNAKFDFAMDAGFAGGEAGFADGEDMAMPQATMEREFATADTPSEAPSITPSDPTESPADPTGPAAPPRLRRRFPETLLWRPQLVVDRDGTTIEVPLADSITTWRLSAGAVSANGELGGASFPIKVFQPFFVDFNLPVALTRGDEVVVPVVVYNYLDKPQTVVLEFERSDWFETLAEGDEATKLTLQLKPGEVRGTSFPIRAVQVGNHHLQVTAVAGEMSDAIRRQIEVVPNGRRIEQVASGTLDTPLETTLVVPPEAIEGSAKTILKLHPSRFSQLVEGLDNIFQMPNGCFEQTSSTTYPNVLALDYLKRTKKNSPEIEAKARQYIHLGYQRLLSFEVNGGGFDWFGNPPANTTLTAYGLMEFEDMARVYDVDPRLIQRTRAWLLKKRAADGSWASDKGMLNDGLASSVQRGDVKLATTAYIAWAVFANDKTNGRATLDYLLSHRPDSIENPYSLALVASAIAAIDPRHAELESYLARLDTLKQSSEDGKQVWWQQPQGGRTTFYGGGRAGDIEATAMAALALLEAGKYPASTRGALAWLAAQKDARGTWHSTQATVLALKALVTSTGKSLGKPQSRSIEIALGNEVIETIKISVDQADVMQQIDLSDKITGGEYRLSVRETTETGTGYQLAFRYHVEDDPISRPKDEPLSIDIAYDRQRLNVDETVTATATVVNNMEVVAPMVILDLPIPGGFTIERGELDELVGSQKIAKYQITPRQAIVYLRRLAPGEQLELRYRLRAIMPVKVVAPPAQAYEYYNPSKRGRGRAVQLEATTET